MPRKLPTKVVVHPDNPIAQAQHALEMAHLYSTPDPGAKGPIDWEKYEDSREDPRGVCSRVFAVQCIVCCAFVCVRFFSQGRSSCARPDTRSVMNTTAEEQRWL